MKTNIGHLEAAAGIAGLIKAVLSIADGTIPRHLHCRTPNPRIPWSEIPLRVATEAKEWSAGASPHIAGISSFGFAGTNAHAIVAEAPASEPRVANNERPVEILTLSARTPAALEQLTARYAAHLRAHASTPLGDIAFTTNVGRAQWMYRRAIVAATTEEALARLAEPFVPERIAADAPRIAFLFTGEGGGDQQYALAKLWRSWGIEPSMAAGTGAGEDVARHFAPDGDGRTCDVLVEIGRADWRAIAKTAAELWQRGARIDWNAFHEGRDHRRVDLPLYPFERQRYWAAIPERPSVPSAREHPLLGRRIELATDDVVFETQLSLTEPSFLRDHRLAGEVLVPGAAWVEMMIAAATRLRPSPQVVLEDVEFRAPLVLHERRVRVQLVISDERITIASRGETRWQQHATARLGGSAATEALAPSIDEHQTVTGDELYAALSARRIEYGLHFRVVETLRRARHSAEAVLAIPPIAIDGFSFDPRLLDGALQVPGSILLAEESADLLVPAGIGRIVVSTDASSPQRVRVDARIHDDRRSADIVIGDAARAPIAVMERVRFAPLHRLEAPPLHGPRPASWAIEMNEPGAFDELRFRYRDVPKVPCSTDEVRIAVRATGLNFRDVLHGLGRIPLSASGAIEFGFECAGVVAEVGSGVSTLPVGTRVAAVFCRAGVGSEVVVPAAFAVALPASMSFEEAATIPLAFLTAAYALEQVAQLRAGQRVLIHAAAGGVGLAAVQMARRAGARVFGTASASKWPLLRAQGVEIVADSRSAAFAESIRDVDVVLHSLGADLVPATLRCCAPGARFIEIGRVGAWDEDAIRAVRPDLRYTAFDLSDTARNDPRLITRLLHDVLNRIARGELTPLPHQLFTPQELPQALRLMARGGHTGKIVIRDGEVPAIVEAAAVAFSGTTLRDQLARATPTERLERMRVHIAQLLEVLGTGPQRELHIDDRFADRGVDSLMAVELAAQLSTDLGTPLSETTLFNHPTIAKLSDYLLDQLFPAPAPIPANVALPGVALPTTGSIEAMSEEQALARLETHLERLR